MADENALSIKQLLPARINTLARGKTFVGIDFGTSTTVVSIASMQSNGVTIETKSIKLDQLLEDGTRFQSERIPSVIAYYNNQILVGEGASSLKYKLKFGRDIWYSFKMDIGTDLGAKYYDSVLADKEPFCIQNPKDAVRVFFMYLNLLINRYCETNGLSTNIEYAISIPASFEANQRKELSEALETNGMKVAHQSLIDEPNAAFISYVQESADSEKPLNISDLYNPKVLVFDFGGGTCDISILEIGKSINGVYSKNISISKFTQLGGNDIDRYITYHYILPRFLEHNKKKLTDFRTPERRAIACQLYKVSEQLKILINKSLSFMTTDFVVPELKNSTSPTEVEYPVVINTSKGSLSQDKFYLTPAELTEVMNVFTKNSRLPQTIKGEEDYNNISMPINSAIEKAKVSRDEIDYVLFIGGSAQSPYIQEALRNMFTESELLVPRDLQTHVSKGAAIHSLLMNGLGKCIIQPITSEPILVITKDNTPRVLFAAGSPIPCDTIVVDDLVTSRENQEQIELPICIGTPQKVLHNLVIKPMNGMSGFPVNTPVQIVLEINADKLLLVKAMCMGQVCMVEPQNPFANKEMSTEERIVLVAERQANLEALHNNGVPTKSSLIALRNAYNKVGNSFRAAETFELQTELYPNANSYNQIGVLYANAGVTEKAIEFYERALQANPNDTYAHCNLGLQLKYRDKAKYREHIRKSLEANPNHDIALIEAASIDKADGKHKEAKEKLEKVYDMMITKWRAGTLGDYGYGWLADVASDLGYKDEAKKIRASKPKLDSEQYYNSDNLTRTRSTQIEKL
jgi:molecular chaperone DnaK (HSP70)